MKELIAAAMHNQVTTGALLLMITGGAMALLRRVPSQVYAAVKRALSVEVEITSDDPLFDSISAWLNEQEYSKKSRRLSARTLSDINGNDCPMVGGEDERPRPVIMFSPAPGNHFFVYKGNLVWLSRNRDTQAPAGSGGSSWRSIRKYETYSITVPGRRQSLIRALIEEAIDVSSKVQGNKISAYVSSWGSWEKLGSYTPRPLDSVILPDGIVESMREDLTSFLAAREWYQSMGIPWHRGYLLSGIPGSGKTSLISALAGDIGMNVYLLNIGGSGMSDERLIDLVRRVRGRSILLMEDVDAAVPMNVNREKDDKADSGNESVSLSGLLNCLDGLTSKDGSVVFMTTNHKEKLDRALLRPGRADVRIEFGAPTRDQLARLYRRFYPLSTDDECVGFEATTMAEAQQKLLQASRYAPRAIGDAGSAVGR